MVAKLQDVAKRAGVTITTVSRVLNDFPHVSKKPMIRSMQQLER